ncbi:MAG: hypothetical protein ACYDEZ_09010 [Methanoregula sp.]
MVKIAYGKSDKWQAAHCCICSKPIRPQENRVKGTATLLDDSVIPVIYHEDCAKNAAIVQACEDLGKGVSER